MNNKYTAVLPQRKDMMVPAPLMTALASWILSKFYIITSSFCRYCACLPLIQAIFSFTMFKSK